MCGGPLAHSPTRECWRVNGRSAVATIFVFCVHADTVSQSDRGGAWKDRWVAASSFCVLACMIPWLTEFGVLQKDRLKRGAWQVLSRVLGVSVA